MNDALIFFGSSVKALNERGRVGGYLVRFSDGANPRRDLTGEYFTSKTFLGSRDGDGQDTYFHHRMSIPLPDGVSAATAKEIDALRNHVFAPVKTRRDAIGIWAETILALSDAYEAAVNGLVRAGKLSWSSGAAAHLIEKTRAGEITRWPIAEASLTFSPAEPLNKVVALNSTAGKFRSERDRARYEYLRAEHDAKAAMPRWLRAAYERNELRRREFAR